jgi:hypothetical protein
VDGEWVALPKTLGKAMTNILVKPLPMLLRKQVVTEFAFYVGQQTNVRRRVELTPYPPVRLVSA